MCDDHSLNETCYAVDDFQTHKSKLQRYTFSQMVPVVKRRFFKKPNQQVFDNIFIAKEASEISPETV